ncbi:MAG: hypothetical protein ACREPK_05300 [Rhodanobacteraceae bacterium]
MADRKLHFRLNDRIGATEVTPDAVSLPVLKQFADEVGKFLSGSKRELDLSRLPVAIVKGSLEITAGGLPDELGLWADVDRLGREDSLQDVDPGRAIVIKQWQDAARKRPSRHYAIAENTKAPVIVSSESAFRDSGKSRWVRSERYVRGSLFESGGKESPNIHLQLAGNKTLVIKASRDQLRDDTENRLYHQVLARVDVEQNLDTGDLRDARLIRFEDYHPGFDPDAFAAFVEEGGKAWRDVGDPAEWVRAQRGG